MVFESLVTELFNRYLGKFVEKLDSSQLKFGLLAGNAVLENLEIKGNAFDEFDLPIRVLHGHIGRLSLQIPFKNIYTKPVVVELDDLYVLIVPNLATPYDEDKETRYHRETKMRELKKIDKANMRDEELTNNTNSDGRSPDSFTEKLIAQIVKNIQINIRNVHVRYEHRPGCVGSPFTMGVTLYGLNFRTSDSSGAALTISDDSIQDFHKAIKLQCLSVYWNCEKNTVFFIDHNRDDLKMTMKRVIPTGDKQSGNELDYVIEPISAEALMRLHMKPEITAYTVARISVNITCHKIKVAFNRSQYLAVSAYVDALDRMWTQAKYKKYRPNVSVKENAREWWKYPVQVVLQDTVRRRRLMWSWQNMKRHRQRCKDYTTFWQNKITGKVLTMEDERMIQVLEDELDVLNIVLCRQKAELSVKKLNMNKAHESPKTGGWFSNWWFPSWSSHKPQPNLITPPSTDADNAVSRIQAKMKAEMNTEEKLKLYKALGYSESDMPPTVPKEYVSVLLNAVLHQFSFTLNNDELSDPLILNLKIHRLCSKVEQRVSASAIKVAAYVDSLHVKGIQKLDNFTPNLISSQVSDKNGRLLDFVFETNPLNEDAHNLLKLSAEPLEFIYDADTVNEIVRFFVLPSDVRFQELSASVTDSIEDVKLRTATSLRHLANNRFYTKVHVNVKPSYFILPENGLYKPGCHMMLADLGTFKVFSENTNSVDELLVKERNEKLDYEKIKEKVYDKFTLSLSAIQVLHVNKGDDWAQLRKLPDSPNHIIKPFCIDVCLKKCIINDDANLPKFSVNGCLPLLHVEMTDAVLKCVLQLFLHIQFPTVSRPPSVDNINVVGYGMLNTGTYRDYTRDRILRSVQIISGHFDEVDHAISSNIRNKIQYDTHTITPDVDSIDSTTSCDVIKNKSHLPGAKTFNCKRSDLVDVVLTFSISHIELTLHQVFLSPTVEGSRRVANLIIKKIGAAYTQRPYDLELTTFIGFVEFSMLIGDHWIPTISASPTIKHNDDHLLLVTCINADKTGPHFLTRFNKKKRKIFAKCKPLIVTIHQDCVLKALSVVNDIFESVFPSRDHDADINSTDSSNTPLLLNNVDQTKVHLRPKPERFEVKPEYMKHASPNNVPEEEIIQWEIKATVDAVDVTLRADDVIATVNIQQLYSKLRLMHDKVEVKLRLNDMSVTNGDKFSQHKNIFTIEEADNVLFLHLIWFTTRTSEPKYKLDLTKLDMSLTLKVGKSRIIFLYKFISRVLAFYDKLQNSTIKEDDKQMKSSTSSIKNVEQGTTVKSSEIITDGSRYLLNVNVKAPLVFVPQNSQSQNAFLLDLGSINITNKFLFSSTPPFPAVVLDHIKFSLENLTLARTLMTEGVDNTGTGCQIIMPINMIVEIDRKLSQIRSHKIPDVAITCQIKSIEAEITHGDYVTLLGIMWQNLCECYVPPASVQLRRSSQRRKRTSRSNSRQSSLSSRTGRLSSLTFLQRHGSPRLQQLPHTTLEFTIDMQKVTVVLFTGDDLLHSNLPNLNRSLAKLKVGGMNAKGLILSDESMNFRVIIGSCYVRDSRPHSNDRISNSPRDLRIFQTKESDSEPALIDVKFTQDKQKNQTTIVEICSIDACVYLAYIMTIKNFFTDGLPESYNRQQPTNLATMSMKKARASIIPNRPLVVIEEEENDNIPLRSSTFVVDVLVRKPDIFFVEDINVIDCNAIFLTTEIDMNYSMLRNSDVFDAHIRDFTVFSCPYKQDLRERFKKKICAPTNISLRMDSPLGGAMHFILETGKVTVSVTPKTIQILSKISTSIVNEKLSSTDTLVVDENLLVEEHFWDMKIFNMEDIPALYEKLYSTNGIDDEENEEADEEEEENASELEHPKQKPPEQPIEIAFKVPEFSLILESQLKKKCMPIFIVESSLNGKITDPVGQLAFDLITEVSVSFYNELLNVWEPIIETYPEDGDRRWRLFVQMTTQQGLCKQHVHDYELNTNQDIDRTVSTCRSFTIESHDNLEMTLSITAIDVLRNLSTIFEQAYNQELPETNKKEDSPYTIHNWTGEDLQIQLDNQFRLPKGADDHNYLALPAGQSLFLTDKLRHNVGLDEVDKVLVQHKIKFSLPNSEEKELFLSVTEKRFYSLSINTSKYSRSIIVDVSVMLGKFIVIFRSTVQIKNKLRRCLEISSAERDASNPHFIFSIESQQTQALPLSVVYSPNLSVFISQSQFPSVVAKPSVYWFEKEEYIITGMFGGNKVYFLVNVENCNVLVENSSEWQKSCDYIVTILDPIDIHNQLHLPISLQLQFNYVEVAPGGAAAVNHIHEDDNGFNIMLDYMGLEWIAFFVMSSQALELEGLKFSSRDGYFQRTLNAAVHFKCIMGQKIFTIFAPFWIMNKTGLNLQFRTSDEQEFTQDGDIIDPFLFGFNSKCSDETTLVRYHSMDEFPSSHKSTRSTLRSFKQRFRRRHRSSCDSRISRRSFLQKCRRDHKKSCLTTAKLYMQVADSNWTGPLPLETVGTVSLLSCTNKNGLSYEIRLSIELSSSCLTKIVTFMPYFAILNQTKISLLFQEVEDSARWIEVDAGHVKPFWPSEVNDRKDLCMRARIPPFASCTKPFPLYESHATFLKLDNEHGGLFVDVLTTDNLCLVSVSSYCKGLVLVKLVNTLVDQSVFYQQSGQECQHELRPGHSVMYTWDDARGRRELTWRLATPLSKKFFKDALNNDGIGDVTVDGIKAYWLSFVDDTQRTLLFTLDASIAQFVRTHDELEAVEHEYHVNLASVGLSVVNNTAAQEMAYISLTGSGVHWLRVTKNDRLKFLQLDQTIALESAYEQFYSENNLDGHLNALVTLKTKDSTFQVDLEKKRMLSPKNAELRRFFEPAFTMTASFTKSWFHCRLKLFHLQVDSQLPDVIFPVVFAPMPPHRSVDVEEVPHHIVDLSLILGSTSDPGVYRIKYGQILVQEVAIKLDQAFISSLINLFSSLTATPTEEEAFKNDVKISQRTLQEEPIIQSTLRGGKRHIINMLHISPLKVHLSFTMTGGQSQDVLYNELVNLLLKSIGVALTEVQDVVFKLGYFERQGVVINGDQLMAQVQQHYLNQAIKQMYVLVFGLDVLGNPFKVLRGFARGFEDLFYEPIKGAVLGPDEFAEGVSIGLRSLFDHTVGGAAGAASRITGAIGKGVAALTLDDNYQQWRRKRMIRSPDNIRGRLAMGGQGLALGLFHGVTGVVAQPISGARKSGVQGFVKGLGRGLLGVVVRPISGMVDFANTGFEGIRQAADQGVIVNRIRPPRIFDKTGVIKPYNFSDADGHRLLSLVDKGDLYSNNIYQFHVMSRSLREVVFVTNRSLILAERKDLLGIWSSVWVVPLTDIVEEATFTSKGVFIYTKCKRRNFFGCASSEVLRINDLEVVPGQMLVLKINQFLKQKTL